jgi:hypothetical protein
MIKQKILLSDAFILKNRRKVLCGVLLVGLCILISRKPDILFNAQFWAEDGRYWYAEAYNNGLRSLLYTYGGYFVFVYHAIALLSLPLPLHLAPVFFNLFATCIQLLPLLLINSSRLLYVFRYRTIALVSSFLYLLVVNADEVFGNLTNIQWHLGVAAFLVLIAKRPTRIYWKFFDYGILLALGLSGPLPILLLPIAGYLWFSQRLQHQKINLLILSVLSMVQVVIIFFLSSYERLGSRPDFHLLSLVKMIVGQIYTGGLLGMDRVGLFYEQPVALWGVFILGSGLVGYALFKGALWLKLMIIFSGGLFVSMLFSLRKVPEFDVWWGLSNPGGGQRYWYIPILTWLSILVWCSLNAKQKAIKVTCISLLALLIVGIPSSWHIEPRPDLDFPKHAQKFETLPSGTTYTIPVNPGWEMTLHKR